MISGRFTLFLLAVTACVMPTVSGAQSATYHLHKESSAITSTFDKLLTAGPDVSSSALTTSLTNKAVGEYVIKEFETQSGVPNAAGVIPSGSTLSFSLWMRKTANVGTVFPRAKVRLNTSTGTLLCTATGTTALTTTVTKQVISCTTSANISMSATDRFYLWTGVNLTGTSSTSFSGEIDIEGTLNGNFDSQITLPLAAPPPSISSLTPNSGAVGSHVRIDGSNFGSVQGSVTFNGLSATISTWSSTSINAVVPGTATTGPVVVTVAGQSSTGVTFTVTPPPNISSLSPSAAVVGARVAIIGTNFSTSPGSVTMNGLAAAVSAWSDTAVVVWVPDGATSGNVVVTSAGSISSNGVPFTVALPSAITSIQRNTGAPGDSVTISGSKFGASQGAITFNGAPAPVSSWSDSAIVATVPTGATSGSVQINGGASQGRFQVINPTGVSIDRIVSGHQASGVPLTTDPLTTNTAPELLLAFVAMGGDGFTASTASVSGGGLSWVLVGRSNVQGGTAEVWRAFSSSLLDHVQISAAIVSGTPQGASLTVVAFAGVDTTGTNGSGAIGAVASAHSSAGAPSVALTTTRNNSLVFAVGSGDVTFLSSPLSRTPAPSQSIIFQELDTGCIDQSVCNSTFSDTLWVQQASTAIPVAGTSVKLNDLEPVGDPYDLVAVEILPASVPASNPTLTSLSSYIGPPQALVTITGVNFGTTQGSSTVTFNGVQAAPTSWSSTSITTTVPQAATTGNVVVRVSGQPSNGLRYIVANPSGMAIDQVMNETNCLQPFLSTSAGNELILALTSNASSGLGTIAPSNGQNLMWEQVGTTNVQQGSATVWRAFSSGMLTDVQNINPANIVCFTGNSLITFVSVIGSDTSGVNGAGAIGSVVSNSSAVGAPSLSLVTTRGDSLVFAVGDDPTAGVARVAGAGQMILAQTVGGTSTVWTQQLANSTAAAGTNLTINDTAPTGDAFNLTAVEVLTGGVVPTIPHITVLSPASGPGNTSVSISGSGFGATRGTSAVTFAGVAATPASWSDTAIVVPVPLSVPPGAASVIVTVGGVASNGVLFTVTAPTITSLSPASGSAGASVTISGSNFGLQQGSVSFAGPPPGNGATASITSWSPSSIVVSVPAGAITGQVFVTDALGNSSNGVTFTVTAPTISSVTPASGPSGTVITINGTFFGATQGSVSVTGAPATISTWSDTSIVATVPASITTGNVLVTDVYGNQSNGSRFTVLNPGGIAVDQIVSGNSSDAFPTTPSFSTSSGNQLLLAFIGASGTSNEVQSVTSVTGGGLNWELVKRANAQFGTAEIWRAFSPTVLNNITVTATLVASNNALLTVVTFTGVDPSGVNGAGAIGATAASNSAAGLPTVTLTTTRNNSLVFAVGDDPTTAAPRTLGPNQGMVFQELDPCVFQEGTFACLFTSSMEWVQQRSTIIPNSGTAVTLNDTAPDTDAYNLAAVEILFGSAAGPHISTLSPVSGPVNTSVSISGSGFGATRGTSTVTFAGVAATPASWSDTTIVVPVPLGVPLGAASVIVTVGGVTSNAATFTVVDATAPAISITAPANSSFTNNPHTPISVSFSDGESGVDITSFHLLVDGLDHTAEFTTTATGSTGSLAAALPDGAHVVTANVRDLAGNQNSTTANFTVATVAPQITNLQPPTNSFTNAASVTVTGTITTSAPLASLTVNGDAATVTGNSFSSSAITLGAGPSQTISIVATDSAGNSASASLSLSIDRILPTIVATATPAAIANWNKSDVTVTFTCADDSSGIASCPSSTTVTTEGAAQVVSGTAVDVAGNRSLPASVTVNLDKTPPVITAAPAPAPNAAGWNNTDVNVTFICSDNLSGVVACPAPTTVSVEGNNLGIPVTVFDVAGNSSSPALTLNIDKTPPTISQLLTPDLISLTGVAQISAQVNDNIGVAQVVFRVNGTTLATFAAPPFQTNLQAPTGAVLGDILNVTVVATDIAGNSSQASHGVRVGADGVVVGQVLDDATSLPLQKANVQAISATGSTDQTDLRGRYSLPSNGPHFFLSITGPDTLATTTVEREVFTSLGTGTVPVDARLTTLASPVTLPITGGTLTAGTISVVVPAGAAPDGTSFQLTPLSGQGLPGMLPIGWSPLLAFDLRASAPANGLTAGFSNLPNGVAHLATYDFSMHAWTLAASNLSITNGTLSIALPTTGDFALVLPDAVNPPIQLPPLGNPLSGIPVQVIPSTSTSSGSMNPPVLPASGGTAIATLGVVSPAPLPSGTVIQANVSEKFSLRSGQVASEDSRPEDIILYTALAPASSSLGAQFAVSPSHKFSNGELLTGKVHLDFLAGREAIRGQTGGNDPVTVTDGTATLSVPGGALAQNTAISVQGISLEDYVPTNTSMNALQEILVDISGETLNTPAQLSISASALNPADMFLLAQVVRVDGIPHLVTAALAHISGNSLVSVASPGLPGVMQGGEYVFYDFPSPIGFIAGVASSASGPLAGTLVQSDSLPLGYLTGIDGHYIVPALVASVTVNASVPDSTLAGSGTIQVVAGQTVALNIAMAGVVTSASISPADGSLGVTVSTTITVTTSAPLDPATVPQASLTLSQGVTPVPVGAIVLSQSGTTLSFAPVVNLNPATQYTVRVSGLSDVFHNPVVVPTSTFTTKAAAPPTFDPNAITFSFPDQNGNIHVTAPAGSLPPGTMVLIVDQSNGIVLSLTAGNDGSLSGNFLGTINDVLQVTVTDPHGASVSFTSTQFVAPDGSVAVGSNGGTVKGPGGIAMIIPSGALDQPAIFSIQPLGADAFPELPAVSGATFGSGIQVNSPSMPFLKKEVKFAFPKPADAPDDAFYYVYRQLTDQNNNNYFETLDHAFVQGTGSAAQVVMASPPFCGYRNSYKNFNTVANASFVPEVAGSNNIFVMWDRSTAQPGKASQGLIVGRALQTVPPNPGQTDPTFVPIQGATIWLGATDTPSKNVAITSDSCGQFTIFDPLIGGGPRDITAKASINGKDVILHTSVTEVNGVQLNDATYLITEGLAAQYRNIGRLTFTFPASTPPPPPAQVDVRLYTEDASNSRRIASGLLSQGTPLVIAFKTSLTVTGASIAGRQLTIVPDYLDNPKDPQALLDFRAVDSSSGDSLQRYIVGNPGPYTLSVTAISVFGGAPITVTKSFLVVASGGSNNVVTTGSHPQIISTIPVQNANRVSIGAFPEITFSEPVTNVPDGVTLTDADGNSPPFVALGVRADGSIANPVGSGDAITSLTIQPLTGLRLGTLYKVSLNSLIVDQNTPPLGLPPFTLQFTTISPQEADQNTDASPLTRSVIIGDRLYAGKFTGPAFSRLEVFDISDPTNPVDKTASSSFPGRSFDVAGLASSPVVRCLTEVLPGQTCPDQAGGGPLIAVAASIATTELPLPSNIWFYDVSQPDQPVRVGAMSATTSATQDGTVLRIFMKGGFVYASTFTKGLQVIDVQQAVNEFQQTPPDQFGGAITTEGNGFALDAVVNTIPIFIQQAPGSLVQALMFDVKAGDYATAFSPDPTALVPTQTLIVATGMVPLVIADPQLGGLSAVVYPPLDNSGTALSQTPLFDGVTGQLTLQQGRAVALGNIPVTNLLGATVNTQIAIVVGMGTSTLGGTAIPQAPVLAVIDMSNAKAPLSRGFVLLKDKAGNLVEPTDVVIKDNLALVGTAAKKVLVVNITDPNRPFLAGEIDGLFGDNLALTGDGTLFTTAPISAIGGVHSASFGSQCSIYRDLISKNPPSLPAINSTPQLGWSMSGGLSVTTADGEVFNRDGFVLTNVKLGRRQLAKSMSLPYVIIKRENDQDPDNPPRCELVNGSDNACTGLASGVNARSNLLTYSATTDNATFVAYQAQFLIDHLDGDPDTNPEVHDTCAVITQKYEFRKEGLKPFEPFGFFPSAKFVPQVSYSYFRDLNGPALESLQTAQRLHFDVRSLAQPDLPPPPAKYSVNNEMLTCDGNAVFGQITNCLPSALTNDSIVGLFQNENPLQQEHFVRIIQNGTSNLVSNPGAILPLKTTIDNFHQNPTPVTAPDQKIDEPGLTVFGCPACVHIHWRWSTNLNSDFPNVFNVDKLFDNNGGNLFLPPNPTQDVDIAIESSGVVHPNSPVQVKDLVSGTRSLLPSQVAQRNAQPVFWYVATGHKNSDQFFLHGGGFGTFFVNKVTAPEQGQGLLSINVEHTRALDYEVVVSRKDQIGTDIDGNLLFNVTSFPLLTGTLQPGTDDIAGSPDMALLPEDGTSNVHELTIDITLTDPTLAPRNIFKRSFSFSFPGTQEP